MSSGAFLRKVLLKKGFIETWVRWIMVCVSTKYKVSVNRNGVGSINPSRGIGQGDPPSLYLFTLVVDVLLAMVSSVVSRGCIRGMKMKRNCPTVSYLLFADDSIFFLHARGREWKDFS